MINPDNLPTFRELRKDEKIPRAVIAKTLGVSVTTVIGWERFTTIPDADAKLVIADMIGRPVDTIRWVPQEKSVGKLMRTERGRSFIVMDDGKVLW